ncbi:MAG: hypothetical protein F4057_09360 [Acidobacteria bacterium]|nr:hypothetical protein [Acidobacteriota bacterium]
MAPAVARFEDGATAGDHAEWVFKGGEGGLKTGKSKVTDQRKQEAVMSGSGGGSSTSRSTVLPSGRPMQGGKGDQNGGDSGDLCDITEDTTLNSPDRTVLATLRDGDELVIELHGGRRLLAKRRDRIAGSVTSARHANILQCMQQGREYKAVELSVKGGACRVRIQLK